MARKREELAKLVIGSFKLEKNKDPYKEEDMVALTVADLKTLYQWKYDKGAAPGMKKKDLVEAWKKVMYSPPINSEKNTWTMEQELQLQQVRKEAETGENNEAEKEKKILYKQNQAGALAMSQDKSLNAEVRQKLRKRMMRMS